MEEIIVKAIIALTLASISALTLAELPNVWRWGRQAWRWDTTWGPSKKAGLSDKVIAALGVFWGTGLCLAIPAATVAFLAYIT